MVTSVSSATSLSPYNEKAFKICNVLGGLDVARYVSTNTRHVFQGTIDDVEQIRETVSLAALLSNSKKPGENKRRIHNILETMSRTFQWKKRGYTSKVTSVEAGYGWVDDSDDRIIERFVGFSSKPLVGDKSTDMAIIESVGAILPWIVDRKARQKDWWIPHQNGRSEGPEKELFLFDSLYTAAWIGTFGDAWAYYPPFQLLHGNNGPYTEPDLTGGQLNVSTHKLPFVEPNLPENNKDRRAFFRTPYPDTLRPGLSLITAMAPVYFTGSFGEHVYNDTYIASTGLDIEVSSVSNLLDVLLDSLTDGSFAIVVDTNFNPIVISQAVVERIYPERTSFEEERVTYDFHGDVILDDRRNKTYKVADTIHQDLTKLVNANWSRLLSEVNKLSRGTRKFSKLNITLTGHAHKTEFYVMYERWTDVADWVLMAFAPTEAVEQAIEVEFSNTTSNRNGTAILVQGEKGLTLTANALVVNKGKLDVTFLSKMPPNWLRLTPVVDEKIVIPAGEALSLKIDILTDLLDFGVSSALLAFSIEDDDYPDCFFNKDISLAVKVRVNPKDCALATGDPLRVPTSDGDCICSPGAALLIGARCVSWSTLQACIFVPVVMLVLLGGYVYFERKRKAADSIWAIKKSELRFDDPPVVLGRGTFGLVLLAEYRGTQVAVKRVIPPKTVPLRGMLPTEASKMIRFNFDHDVDLQQEAKRTSVENACKSDRSDEPKLVNWSNGTARSESGGSGGDVVSGLPQLRQTNEGSIRCNRSSSTTISTAHKRNTSENFEKLKTDFISEMRLLSKLRHPTITTVMGAVIDRRDEPLLVMECMDNGSLFDLLQNETLAIKGDMVLPILRDISQGLRFLHAANPQIIHGDIKSHNVLVDSKFRAKVSDFGLSGKREVGAACGTPFWMAPELLRGEASNSAASDAYSFGIVLFEVYSRQTPYEEEEDENQVIADICNYAINKRPRVPQSMPNDVASLMATCVEADPSKRPSFREIDERLRKFTVTNVEPGQVSYSLQKKKAKVLNAQSATDLLLEILPKHVAEALSSGRRVEPEHFECVTIFFSDIVGFTSICDELSPMKVSDMLDRLYLKFDALSQEHDVFKVETIGDAWMGVTNVARQQPDHTRRIAKFAMATIVAASETLIDINDRERGYVRIRVGFHSGPVIANVVGSRNPKYTIIGDTVNTSARMESNSDPGRILCSDSAAKLLAKQAPCIPIMRRGIITVKGKGEMETFWVNEMAPSKAVRMESATNAVETTPLIASCV